MVENRVFNMGEIVENFLEVYIILKYSKTLKNVGLERFMSIF